jgi:predicted ester cyclase
MGFLFGRKKNKHNKDVVILKEPLKTTSSSTARPTNTKQLSSSSISLSSCYTSANAGTNTGTGIHSSSKTLQHSNQHGGMLEWSNTSGREQQQQKQQQQQQQQQDKSKSKSSKQQQPSNSNSKSKSKSKSKKSPAKESKSSKSKNKSSSSSSKLNTKKSSSSSSKHSSTTTKQKQASALAVNEVQTQYYQQESQPTIEVKVIGDNRHVTTTTIDDLGRHVQQTKVTKLTDDELNELGTIFSPKKVDYEKTSTKNEEQLSSTSFSNYLSDSNHSGNSGNSGNQEHQHHQQRLLIRSNSVESFVDEMTMDPHSDYFNFMDPDAPPVPETTLRRSQPKSQSKVVVAVVNNDEEEKYDDNKNNASSTSLLFEDFMANHNDVVGTSTTKTMMMMHNNKNTSTIATNTPDTISVDGIISIRPSLSANASEDTTTKEDEEKVIVVSEAAATATTNNTDIIAHNNIGNMNETTRDLVKTFIGKIWNHGEIDYIPIVCSPSLRFNGRDGLERVGHDGFSNMVYTVRQSVAEYHCAIHSMVVENNKCFCRLKFTGRHVGELLGYKPTNKILNWMGASEFTICPKRNQILKVWELGDIHTLEEQLKG